MAKKPVDETRKLSNKRLLEVAAVFKGRFIVAFIFAVFGAACSVAAPLIVSTMMTEIIKLSTPGSEEFASFNISFVIGCACVGLAIALTSFALTYVQGFIIADTTSKIGYNLRNKIQKKINKLPLNYFDSRNIGDVLSYTTNDIETIATSLNNTLATLVTSVITLVAIIVMMFIVNWLLAFVALVFIPLAVYFLKLISDKGEKHFLGNQDSLAEVNSLAEENFTAFNIIRVFKAKHQGLEKFYDSNKKLQYANFHSNFYGSMMDPVMKGVSNVSFAIICLVAGFCASAIAKEMGQEQVEAIIPGIVACLMYVEQLLQPLSQFSSVVSQMQLMFAASDRVFMFLEGEEEEDESHKTEVIDNIKGDVEFKHVKFGYTKDRVIVKDFSEFGKHGQKIAIVGPTGAGKTTMVNLLMRFYDIDSGEIRIDGHNTKNMNRSYVRSLFGMVLQDTWLFEGTFLENLKFSRRDASDEEVMNACKATHCDTFIRQQPGGYKAIVSDGLSSGQKQLVTIARAMVQNAPMLILDEATSSVDTRTELLIQDAMDQLMKGRTSFVIAHRLSTIKNSDLILVMRDGDVIESGTHDSLMAKNGFYAELYNSQFSDKGPQIE